jgi:glycosyltransferase involved in cell wall biosynthesis
MNSVTAQSLATWEHIVVDDGSDDGTAEEVSRRAKADARVRYTARTGDKAGANVCRNIGIRESRADLIVFLDSDDLLTPQCLERRVQIMHRNLDLDFAVFRAGVFRKSVGDLARLYHPQNPGDDLLRFLAHECPWQTSGPVWRRGFLEKIGCFDESLLSMQDLEMHVRALAARGRYVCFSDVDHHIRWHDDSSKTSVRHFSDPAYIRATDKVRAKLFETARSSGVLTWTRQRALAGLSFGTAQSWARSGQISRAVRAWNGSCDEQQLPWHLRIAGSVALCTMHLSRADTGLFARLVNKWKGWVRFRQEPALLHPPNNTSPAISSDNAS